MLSMATADALMKDDYRQRQVRSAAFDQLRGVPRRKPGASGTSPVGGRIADVRRKPRRPGGENPLAAKAALARVNRLAAQGPEVRARLDRWFGAVAARKAGRS